MSNAGSISKEAQIFEALAAIAGIGVTANTIQKRQPPEPDILCRLTDGTTRAFELTEICNPRNAAFMGSAQKLSDMIEDAYRSLPPETRTRFDSKFADRPLSFHFRDGASLSRIRSGITAVLTDLLGATERGGSYLEFRSPKAAGIVSQVRFAGRLNQLGAFNFNIGGFFDPSAQVVDGVAAKLSKKYVSDYPIDLLAHFGGYAVETTDFEEPLRALLAAGPGPFSRIFVLGQEKNLFQYP